MIDIELEDIVQFVNNEFDTNIKNKNFTNKRDRNLVELRALYFKLAREYTNESLKSIGKVLDKNHATVCHSNNNTFPATIYHNRYVRNSYNKFKRMVEFGAFGDEDSEKVLDLKKVQHITNTFTQEMDSLKIKLAKIKSGSAFYWNLREKIDENDLENFHKAIEKATVIYTDPRFKKID